MSEEGYLQLCLPFGIMSHCVFALQMTSQAAPRHQSLLLEHCTLILELSGGSSENFLGDLMHQMSFVMRRVAGKYFWKERWLQSGANTRRWRLNGGSLPCFMWVKFIMEAGQLKILLVLVFVPDFKVESLLLTKVGCRYQESSLYILPQVQLLCGEFKEK